MSEEKHPIDVITDPSELTYLLKTGTRLVVNFHAPWAPPCAQMNQVFIELHKAQPATTSLRFATAAAEALPDLTAKYDISTVPTFLCFAQARVVRRRSGADPAALAADVKWLAEASLDQLQKAACEVVANLGEITLVMKGSPDTPKCGFSRQVVELLRGEGVVFKHFDVLQDDEVRQWMKTYADWATYPMLFASGRLVGGLDVLRQLKEEGKLIEELARGEGQQQPIGQPPAAAPEEGSGKQGAGATTGAAGGSDGVPAEDLNERLSRLTTSASIVVFMKGSPDGPRCGFSRRMVELLHEENVQFGHFDILTDPQVRAGLKTYSDWPTYPQVYANGRFVGGLDVVTELREAGELRTELGVDEAAA